MGRISSAGSLENAMGQGIRGSKREEKEFTTVHESHSGEKLCANLSAAFFLQRSTHLHLTTLLGM